MFLFILLIAFNLLIASLVGADFSRTSVISAYLIFVMLMLPVTMIVALELASVIRRLNLKVSFGDALVAVSISSYFGVLFI
jgi:hypothetical protein